MSVTSASASALKIRTQALVGKGVSELRLELDSPFPGRAHELLWAIGLEPRIVHSSDGETAGRHNTTLSDVQLGERSGINGCEDEGHAEADDPHHEGRIERHWVDG